MAKKIRFCMVVGMCLMMAKTWGCARDEKESPEPFGHSLPIRSSGVMTPSCTTTSSALMSPHTCERVQTEGTEFYGENPKIEGLRQRDQELCQEELAVLLTQSGVIFHEALEELSMTGMQKETPYIEACREWVPSHLKNAKDALSILALEIVKESKPLEIPVFQEDAKMTARYLDPGFSAGGVSMFLAKCLGQVSSLHESLGISPMVVVPGCGHGFDLWKLIVAGGYVVGIENHPALVSSKRKLNLPGKMAIRAAPYLPQGIKVKDCAKILEGDVVPLLKQETYRDFFNVSYGSNLIHCLAPAHAKAYGEVLFRAMKKGGVVFEMAHLPVVEVFEIYQKQVRDGKVFPGYVVENLSLDIPRGRTSSSYEALDATSEQLPPVELRFGHYRKGDKRNLTQRLRAKYKGVRECYHRSIVGYDAQTLSSVMTQAGFVMDDLFYLTLCHERVEVADVREDGTLTDKSHLEKLVRVCFIGHKP